MTDKQRQNKKSQILKEIIAAKGFKTIAAVNVGIDPKTLRKWAEEDEEFADAVSSAVEFAKEYRDDVAEQKLYSLVESGDTTATIFYCKTRLKNRGYSERPLLPVAPPQEQQTLHDKPREPQLSSAEVKRKITAKKDYIVSLLKKQGKYTAELSMQVALTAELLVRTETLKTKVYGENYQPIKVEISREGNKRESINQMEKLYLDYLHESQKALRALCMNADSKNYKADNDDTNDFFKRIAGELGE